MYYKQHWVIQWDRVNTVEDVVEILMALNPTFEPHCNLTPRMIELCRLEDKPGPASIPLSQPPPSQGKENG